MKKIIVASNNAGKIREINEILGADFRIVSQKDEGITIDVEETGSTFLENAVLKAESIYNITGEMVLSDDSGLEVDALDGAPGVYSARYSGEHATDEKNTALLLKNLENEQHRSARFKCVVVLYYAKDKYIAGYGQTEGTILREKEGGGGFGYDPVFYSLELNKSFGTASPDEKNKISHRRRALDDMLSKVKRAGLMP